MLFNEPYSADHPGLTPPVTTYQTDPYMPVPSQLLGIHGHVILSLVVRKDGHIDDIKVLKGLGNGNNGFEEEAIYALNRWEYEPGSIDGEPVDVIIGVKLIFPEPKYKVGKSESTNWGYGQRLGKTIELIQARRETVLKMRRLKVVSLRAEFPLIDGKVNTRGPSYYEQLRELDETFNRSFPRVNWVNLNNFEDIEVGMTMAELGPLLGNTQPLLTTDLDDGRTMCHWFNFFGDGQIVIVFNQEKIVDLVEQENLREY